MKNTKSSFTKTFSIDLERENYQKNIKKGRKIRFLFVLFLWLMIFSFLLSPFSKIKEYQISNLYLFEEEEIIDMSNVENNFFFLTSNNIIRSKMLENDYLLDVKITKKVGGINLEIKELLPLGIIDEDLLLNNGNKVSFENYYHLENIDTNLLPQLDFDQTFYNDFASSFSKLDYELISNMKHISLIENNNYINGDILFESEEVGFIVFRVDLNYLKIQLSNESINNIILDIKQNFGEEKHLNEAPVLVEYLSIDANDYIISK